MTHFHGKTRMSTAPVWLFDLDNTLHNASPHIFPHINRSMTSYLERHLSLSSDEANALRMHYWHQYGATLLGLMRHHKTDPHHFLHETHSFERLHKMMVFDRALKGMLKKLPGRKIVFSNAPRKYVEAVLGIMGIRNLFDEVASIETLNMQPKPGISAYRCIIRRYRLNPRRCIMVEDTAVNLRTARKLGMRTVLVGSGTRQPAYVSVKLRSILQLRRSTGKLLG